MILPTGPPHLDSGPEVPSPLNYHLGLNSGHYQADI